MGWSLSATTRSQFEYRAVITGGDREELAARLAAVAAGEPSAGVVTGAVPPGGAGRVVFVFAGHGRSGGDGRELAGCSPVFADRLAQCSAALVPYTAWRVEDVLDGTAARAGTWSARTLQPVLWAVSVALAAVWEAAGVTPDAVAGHSQGEVAAACVAGILSVEDAAAVIAGRSRVLMRLSGHGGMLSVAEPAAAVRERIASFGERLSVAVVNSPAATVVSGELAALEELAARCEQAGVRAHRVPIDYASHSAQAEQVREELLAALDGITPRAGHIPMISAATGELVQGPELVAGYWYASLRSVVDFERAVRALGDAGHRVFIEVFLTSVLSTAITRTLEDAAADNPEAVVTGTLRRGDGGPVRLVASLAEAHVHGVTVDWAAVLGGGRRVDLPTYAFQRRRYWPRPGQGADVRSAGLGAVGHPLLGAAVELAEGDGLILTGRLSAQAQPWLARHAAGGTALLPGERVRGTGDAGGRPGRSAGKSEEPTLQAPLAIPEDAGVQVQVVAGAPQEHGHRPVQVFSRPDDGTDGPWTRHATGLLAPDIPAAAGDFADFAAGTSAASGRGPDGGCGAVGRYSLPAEYGLQPVEGLARAAGGVAARRRECSRKRFSRKTPLGMLGRYGLHPALLDAVLGAAWAWPRTRNRARYCGRPPGTE